MPNELPRILDWAWRKGHSISSGSQIAPEVQAVAACVATAVAASSCAHFDTETTEAIPQPQKEYEPPAAAEFPIKLHITTEIFHCTHTCAPSPNKPEKPAWLEKLDIEENRERLEWDNRIRAAEEAARDVWRKHSQDYFDRRLGDKVREEMRRPHVLQCEKDEWENRVQQRREKFTKRLPYSDELERYKREMQAYYGLIDASYNCQGELRVCEAKEKKTTEFAANISQINSVEPLALNMEIVPAAARALVERYLQLDRQFCDGFPATAGEFIKLKPKWESATQDFGRLQQMMKILDARFQQYGAFEAFYAMQELVEFDEQFRPTIPPEIFAVINADFQRKTKLWWKYVREDVRGLGLVYDSFQARDEAARKKPPPKSFLPYKPGDPIIPY